MEEWTVGIFESQVQFLFFLITTLWNSLKWNVIQQLKICDLKTRPHCRSGDNRVKEIF